MTRTIVFGGNSFIGAEIFGELSSAGCEVVQFTRADFDFSSEQLPKEYEKYFAGKTRVVIAAAKAPARDTDDLIYNIKLISNLAKILSVFPVNYILNISSDAVYSDSMTKLNESSPKAPESVHGIMHCMREKILAESFAGRLGNIRPTLVFGENDPHNGYGPNSFIRKADANEDIELYGEGEELRDHIFVGDVAKIAAQMLKSEYLGSLNAVSGNVESFKNIAETIVIHRNSSSKVLATKRIGRMPHNGYRAFDNTKLLEFLPSIDFTSVKKYAEVSKFGKV